MLALLAVDPFPVFIPSAPTQSSQGLKHELSLRVRAQASACALQLPLLFNLVKHQCTVDNSAECAK